LVLVRFQGFEDRGCGLFFETGLSYHTHNQSPIQIQSKSKV
jgi:hypothetical protein